MGRMTELLVEQVAFVRRPANKRSFILFKSKDKNKDKDKNRNKKGKKEGEETMSLNAEILKAARKLLDESKKKSETLTADDIVEKLQEDLDEDLSEAETLAIKSIVEFEALGDENKRKGETAEDKLKREKKEKKDADALAAKKKKDDEEAEAAKKKKEEEDKLKSETEKKLEKATADIEKLTKQISEQQDVQKQRDEVDWIKKNARFAVSDVDAQAKDLVELEKASPTAAKSLKETLKKTSKALEDSAVFKSVGSNQPGHVPDSLKETAEKLTSAVDKAKKKKSDSKESDVDVINKAMNTPEASKDYGAYRDEFRGKSRTLAAVD